MSEFKHYLLTFLILFFVCIFGYMFPLLIVDPLNISKFELSHNEFFIKEMRFQSAAIINKFEIDSAIVGSSMAANFKASEAKDKLGGNFQNLSLDGSLLKERKILLEFFLSKKNVKTLIISIDGVTDLQRNKGIPIEAWSFLYNNNYFDDFSLYTNWKYTPYISCHSMFAGKLSDFIFGECPQDKIREHIDDLTEWQSIPDHNSRFGGIEKWLEHKGNPQVSTSIKDIKRASAFVQKTKLKLLEKAENYYNSIEFSRNLVPLIKNYPQTRFILFFPPYSIFKYAIDVQTAPHIFSRYKDLVKRVVLETKPYPNAEVYWFGDKDFVMDIANYKDLSHYNGYYNSVFLDDFSMKRSIIDMRNYERLLNDLEREAISVDLVGLAKKFK